MTDTKRRFVTGACVGAGFGVLYMIRCLVKKEEP
jgi:hypothetical protein